MQPHFHGNAAYGVCHDFNDGTYFYLCAIQVTEAELNTLPEGWISLEIPEHDFAVYEHTDSVDKIGDTWTSIMHDNSVTRDHGIPSATAMTTLHQMHTSHNDSVNFLCGEFIQSDRAVFVMLQVHTDDDRTDIQSDRAVFVMLQVHTDDDRTDAHCMRDRMAWYGVACDLFFNGSEFGSPAASGCKGDCIACPRYHTRWSGAVEDEAKLWGRGDGGQPTSAVSPVCNGISKGRV
ncbi:hypothetical protein DYB36_002163 [Aphanomyces astaci]|uniref:Integron-associated effector binding protein domain-containing protein n=1 Tax=Aphanomyces astaci TaxID=112090 RepID=A0A397A3D9_APHAT|nr:hypothetical protein DYB36_002163 [Aphanomyces astaci]